MNTRVTSMKTKIKNPVYESKIELNPITGDYKETELFNSGMFDKVRYLRTRIVNGEHYI